jgi:hypothetical protein
MTYPLFVYVEFEPTDAPKTPLTPVEGVDLAYNKGGSLEWTRFTTKGGCSCHQMWSGVAEYINEFTKQLPDYAIVGWNLRNLDWPAIVFNVLAQNVKLDKKLLLPLTQKWNNLPLVDLRNLVLARCNSHSCIRIDLFDHPIHALCHRLTRTIIFCENL